MRTTPFDPTAVQLSYAPPAAEAVSGLPDTMPGLAELTSALACAVQAPAVLVTIDPDLLDGALAYGSDCDGVSRVVLGAELLADEMRLRGVLAHEIAHHALRHGQGAVRWWDGAANAALAAALVAIVAGLPLAAILGAAAAAIALRLISGRVQRLEEYDADTYSVRLLEAAGLDGHAIVTATLAAIPQESRWYRVLGWIAGSHPTPDARRRAIASGRWAPAVGIRS
ncbi:M48 family metalloprotease [Streptosporangium sandarakinum]|uniref:M48 family metalloprotease n=1 Tax=Streptosporangium sandarakinum TaxID=1260955 RepID=UPI00371B220E